MTLWKKEYDANADMARFTVGNDYVIDLELVHYDCVGSMAHAKMLCAIGLLTEAELGQLLEGLGQIQQLHAAGRFEISPADEDGHTAIEKYLTQQYGDTGKKIHTCRSRNDQVLTALRLYEKEMTGRVLEALKAYEEAIKSVITRFGNVEIPGYTHMQKAMPASVGMWMQCFIHANLDNAALLKAGLELLDQSPLGTAAGFGVPVFSINQKMTADHMGFARVMENPMYAQMSRGKFEGTLIHLLSQVMFDLNKLATDLMLFSMQEFGFVSLPKALCTGSSIMPQKKNPDVLELIRAKYHLLLGEEFKVKSLIGNLMSGYNRDLQLVKEPVINAFDTTLSSLGMMCLVLSGMTVDAAKCGEAMTPELYATRDAYLLVQKGMPFRDAYREIGKKF